MTNLAELLESKPDEISPLTGFELVDKKVSMLVAMGGKFPEGREWNFEMDPLAARSVVKNWPTRIIFSGFEIGKSILTGGILGEKAAEDNPVKAAYKLYTGGKDRMSWDLATVLCAVRGVKDYWDCETWGRVSISKTGQNKWLRSKNGKIGYLRQKKEPALIAKELNDLLLEV